MAKCIPGFALLLSVTFTALGFSFDHMPWVVCGAVFVVLAFCGYIEWGGR